MNTILKYVILQKQIFHDLISYNGKALKTITHLLGYFVRMRDLYTNPYETKRIE